MTAVCVESERLILFRFCADQVEYYRSKVLKKHAFWVF